MCESSVPSLGHAMPGQAGYLNLEDTVYMGL